VSSRTSRHIQKSAPPRRLTACGTVTVFCDLWIITLFCAGEVLVIAWSEVLGWPWESKLLKTGEQGDLSLCDNRRAKPAGRLKISLPHPWGGLRPLSGGVGETSVCHPFPGGSLVLIWPFSRKGLSFCLWPGVHTPGTQTR
jgi:hypothetical protein